MRQATVLAGLVMVLVSALPARAQIFHDDDDGWCLWCFHRYGGDVNRPGWTPDRPYWHGDDAVPLSMRWQDLAAARAEAAAADAAAATQLAGPGATATRRRRHLAHRTARIRAPAKNCPPVLVRKD